MIISEAAVVIDCGTDTCKVGRAGECAPSHVPSVVGTFTKKHVFVGEEAIVKGVESGDINLIHPIEKGLVENWESMGVLLHCLYDQVLKMEPQLQPVFLTDHHSVNSRSRETFIQIMFEEFSVPAANMGNPAVLSLFASAKTTGLAVCLGEGVSSIVPVQGGYILPLDQVIMNFSGSNLTEHMLTLLAQRDYYFESFAEKETGKDIKEKLCYVAYNCRKEKNRLEKTGFESIYELPDGCIVSVCDETYKCPEALFSPIRSDYTSLQECIVKSISKTDYGLDKVFYSNICLSGGSSLFKGLSNRLKKELTKLTKCPVTISSPVDRKYSTWIGGSLISSLSCIEQFWYLAAEYDECAELHSQKVHTIE